MSAELPRSLTALPAGMLPPGRLVTPEDGGPPPYWLSDDPAEPGVWARLRARHSETGLWPLMLIGLSRQESRPWVDGEVDPAQMSSPDRHDPAELLARGWDDGQPVDGAEAPVALGPFGADWPGLADPGEPAEWSPDAFADEYADFLLDRRARLGLVPAARSADTLAVTGWLGTTNYSGDSGELAAIVRSWEERFGARVVGIGFDTLHLSVAAPPTTVEHALRVAAEHFACCPDLVWQGDGTLTEYAEEIVGRNCWSFWWD